MANANPGNSSTKGKWRSRLLAKARRQVLRATLTAGLLLCVSAQIYGQDCLYTYRAEIVSVYDGDTVTADIDLGMRTWLRGEKLRLHRIDAPEVRGAEREDGLRARDFLRTLLRDRDVTVRTVRDRKGKYGRYLAELWVGDWNVNDSLVAAGHAEYRTY